MVKMMFGKAENIYKIFEEIEDSLMKMTLEHGRPADTEGRLEKELRTYDLLDSLGISYDRVDHDAAETMEACAEVDKLLMPASMCKNLFLCNRQKTNFYLLMIEGDKKFLTKDLSAQISSARLSFAPGEFMEEYLDITPGSMSIMGLMNDHDNKVTLLVEENILEAEYVGCHPCINTASLRIKSRDVFEKFLPATGHAYTVVKL